MCSHESVHVCLTYSHTHARKIRFGVRKRKQATYGSDKETVGESRLTLTTQLSRPGGFSVFP